MKISYSIGKNKEGYFIFKEEIELHIITKNVMYHHLSYMEARNIKEKLDKTLEKE